MNKFLLWPILALCLLSFTPRPALAAEIVLQLSLQSGYSGQDFGTAAYPAYTMVWAGDVYYLGNRIGDYTGTLTKTNYTGQAGSVQNFDIVVPGTEALSDFVSVRVVYSAEGRGAGQGIIYAASPAFTAFIGSTVTMDGDTMRIVY